MNKKKQQFKSLRVDTTTHTIAKSKAKQKGMTIKGFILYAIKSAK